MAVVTSHPMQPVIRDEIGVVRFKPNAIIEHLFATGALDMNVLATMPFSREDRMQIAQQLGYSVSGFGDLSYATSEMVNAADLAAARLP